jgi:deoxyribodipyrimidine photo-lyase
MTPQFDTGMVWLRRDLRTCDSAAIATALQRCKVVHCAFVFDRDILDLLPSADRRVEFIRESLVEVDASLRSMAGKNGAGLIVVHAVATEAIPALARSLRAHAVFAARDYEPQAKARDAKVAAMLATDGIAFETVKDQVIFEGREVLTQSGNPYGVYTPYWRAWNARLGDTPAHSFDCNTHAQRLAARPTEYQYDVPSLVQLGFEPTNLKDLAIPTGMQGAATLLEGFWPRMDHYTQTRDFPAVKGPSYLSVHLRFGTVSVRQLVGLALRRHLEGSTGATTWLKELVWREFYFQVLQNFPHVATHAFKPDYDRIVWDTGAHADQLFEAWCAGRTGYPLVDAAMRQLNSTGYMHNRLRMVAGSFLVKHLGLDWRRGEAYFARTLNDFDLAANNGGWQWVSSSGCDAQPYFRIFNPVTQSEKFDAQGKFILRYVPELAGLSGKALHAPWLAKPLELSAAGITLGESYPRPVVDHSEARERTLQRYAAVKNSLNR